MSESSVEIRPALRIAEYSRRALLAEQQGPELVKLEFALLGLFGEAGTLLSAVKKKHRDQSSYLGYGDIVVEELGDVLWYMNVLAARAKIRLEDIAATCEPEAGAPSEITFHDLQPAATGMRTTPSPSFERTLLRLAGQVGLVAAQGASLTRDVLFGSLTEILQTLVEAACEAGVGLEEAAAKNLLKITDRWPQEKEYPVFTDEALPEVERFPRKLTIEIFEKEVGSKSYVYQRCGDINIGDRLTDNILEQDDYRFHDVFHYAYVAVLGWSPVMRSLFKLKRKSLPQIDEAEDGARATLIEEGITTWIFGQAKELDLFENVRPGQLSFDLLKNVRRFVAGFEPDRLPLWLWEEAILQGYEAFRFMQAHRAARLTVDMSARRLTAEPLT